MNMPNPRSQSLIIGLLFGSVFSLFVYAEEPTQVALQIGYCANELRAPSLTATAGFAVDLTDGSVLYDKHAEAQLPLASLAKTMTVLTARTTLHADSPVTITPEALTPEGESGLIVGEVWTAGGLSDFTLITSSNDGARALMLAGAKEQGISHAEFVEAMNRRARAFGMTSTYFLNETGLDVSSTTAGAYGSARDIAILFGYLALREPELVERSVLAEHTFYSLSGRTHEAKNTALLASVIQAPVASKTGFTDLAGGNIALVFEPLPGRPVALSVLGSTRDGRVRDAEVLAEYAAREVERRLRCSSLYD